MLKSEMMKMDSYQILHPNGDVDESRLSEMDVNNGLLLSMYEWMLKTRILDARLLKMQRQGRIGTYAPFSGQEAAQVGSALALQKLDWIFPTYREIAACMVHGLSIEQAILYFKGHLHGGRTPDNLNIFPIQIIIAGQIPQAAGCAWASKLKGENNISVSYFGDGATSEGDFHEGLNFAAVYQLPVLFFCQNNHWAISLPLHKQMASESIAQKAVAYGMKGVQVDGNDVLAVYQVTREAAERARNGQGPTLIEAVTYRQGPHTTADDPTKYRNAEEVSTWTNEKDPIVRFEAFLLKRGLISEADRGALTAKLETEVAEAISEAEMIQPSSVYDAFDHVYDSPHKLLQEQKEEIIQRRQGKGESDNG
ncbi:pyruvate dehydrogenase (acetyl-transferring) E1 component subunit alpha [Aneurinibacillus tyrosinisolvens]|uniref:pyruvate dehydrogenase (acetyl-transferring) E1 component subunit alpha n=1 Tax=Aneurinibacillus tyrosinisolvens TaxID=1443435 RepID=UPI00063F013F|nr:pyruvate dehydrogenase (acetyl-transferring) E1 component subunit alpha [Aneurinibacillus tyrosinisolvens]